MHLVQIKSLPQQQVGKILGGRHLEFRFIRGRRGGKFERLLQANLQLDGQQRVQSDFDEAPRQVRASALVPAQEVEQLPLGEIDQNRAPVTAGRGANAIKDIVRSETLQEKSPSPRSQKALHTECRRPPVTARESGCKCFAQFIAIKDPTFWEAAAD